MTNKYTNNSSDTFGSQVARRLDTSTQQLPSRVTDRLAAGRKAAMAAMPTSEIIVKASSTNSSSTLTLSGSSSRWGWNFLGFALPALVLVVGLFIISVNSDDLDANEQAEIDEAVMTDDVPISGYADRGFGVFIRNVQQ
jgi:Protein of unknown function (DUF3619)